MHVCAAFCVCVYRLRELCVKLMFLHPVDYGRKAEELLWRKVYYEVIQVIKTNKKVTGSAAVCKETSWHMLARQFSVVIQRDLLAAI